MLSRPYVMAAIFDLDPGPEVVTFHTYSAAAESSNDSMATAQLQKTYDVETLNEEFASFGTPVNGIPSNAGCTGTSCSSRLYQSSAAGSEVIDSSVGRCRLPYMSCDPYLEALELARAVTNTELMAALYESLADAKTLIGVVLLLSKMWKSIKESV